MEVYTETTMTKKATASGFGSDLKDAPEFKKAKFRIEEDVENFITLRIPCSFNHKIVIKKLWTSDVDTFYRCNCIKVENGNGKFASSYFVKISKTKDGFVFSNMTIEEKEKKS